MSLNSVFIVKTSHFFPNSPVLNEDMELYLGYLNGKASKMKNIVLRNNGIKKRYYALDKNGTATHTNAELTALAIRELMFGEEKKLNEIPLIACGTSSPDQMMPSHGVMVHGWLPESGSSEIITPSGNCCAGMHALKYAYLAIKCGEVNSAISTGSERLSRILSSDQFEDEIERLSELEENPHLAFEKDFLRWMLSDGAGAFLLSDKPGKNGISLKIEWLEGASFAHMAEACMYMASEKSENGQLKSFMDFDQKELMAKSIFSIKQDVRLLDAHIVSFGYETLKTILNTKNISVDDVDYFLPHLSSEYFRYKIADTLKENGMEIPQEKWFTNLTQTGNVGAASIYLMLDEMFSNGMLKKGDRLLLMVPESARFSYMYGYFTVV